MRRLRFLGLGRRTGCCYAGQAATQCLLRSPKPSAKCSIPKQPFADLLTAFRQDQTVTRYHTMEDVLAYCRYSANPVAGWCSTHVARPMKRDFALSDATCSALQLANFWQDVREDFARGRVYLPQSDMEFFQVSDETISDHLATPDFAD